MGHLKHIICFSGGHSSALVAIEVAKRYGTENLILLNHDINPKYEDPDIKRFKAEISNFLAVPITYANYRGITQPCEIPSQFAVCVQAGALTDPTTTGTLCTSILKTIPFDEYLRTNFYPHNTLFEPKQDCIIYYGFDKHEGRRIQRRSSIMAAKGYKICCPRAQWQMSLETTTEINIEPPLTYDVFEHANCKGCLKASLLHWYVVWVYYPLIYVEATEMEQELDFTIHTIVRNGAKRAIGLEELQTLFAQMNKDGVPATEHQSKIKFAKMLRSYQVEETEIHKPCECFI